MKHLLILTLVILGSLNTLASDYDPVLEQLELEGQQRVKIQSGLSPDEIYRRTQIVLKLFNAQSEENLQNEISKTVFTTPLKDLSLYLKRLDPSAQFSRFFKLTENSLQSFADRDSKQVPEYIMPVQKIVKPKMNSLKGVRIALDPGHMVGDEWDVRTGKFVVSGSKKVSEALIALQTAMLLEAKLKEQGAEVLITKRGFGGVSQVPYENLDIQKHGRTELKYNSLSTWFQNLLTTGDSAETLGPKFKADPTFKRLFSGALRSTYYAQREDLYARDKIISNFKPDFTIIIHFDAATREPATNVKNKTYAFVAGSFPETDFSLSEVRGHFMMHLAKMSQWSESVRLSRILTQKMSKDLKVPLATGGAHKGELIAPGIYTRNLVLSRRLTDAPVAYLECLYYANQEEFNRLSNLDGGSLIIEGKEFKYPQRLNELSQALYDGIVEYASTKNF